MNKTYGDLMSEFEHVRTAARSHSSWDGLNKFVEELIKQIAAPKVEQPLIKSQEYSFDANGGEVHEDNR